MADILLFIREGWKNLWKQKIIWMFSALALFNEVFLTIQTESLSDWSWFFISLAKIFSIVLWFVSLIAVPYLVYSFATGKMVNIWETLSAVGKFAWRVIGCSCLAFLVVLPCFLLVVGPTLDRSTQPPQISNQVLLMFLPFSIIACMPDFTMFGFFANDWGIRQSLKNAWTLFTTHFGVLAILGIIMMIIFRTYSIASGVLTVLIQSNLDVTSLTKINYINPFVSLSNNLLFLLLSGICQTVFIPLTASIFALAYLKYSATKMKVNQ